MPDFDITADLTSGEFDGVAPNAQDGATALNGQEGNVSVNQTPQAAPQPNTLRDELTNAFKAPEEPAAPNAETQQQQPAPQLTKDAEGKYRNLDGTFASVEAVQAFEAAQAAPATNTAQEAVVTGLTPVEQEQFKALPPELQQFVARTTQALNERASRYGEYDMMEQVLGPRRAAFAQDGITAPIAIAQLFQLSDFAAKDPGQFILWYSQQRGVDLDELLDSVDNQQGPVDPVIQSLQTQVATLTGQLQNQTLEQQTAAHNERIRIVEQVATELDEHGALKRPHFAELGDTILPFVDAARTAHPDKTPAEQLAIAYDNACWANPTVREKMQKAVTPAPQNVPQQHAQRAAAASSSITGQPTGDPSKNPNNSNRTLREEIEFNVSQYS